MDIKYFELPNGKRFEYDASYDIDDIMGGVVNLLDYLDDGSKFNNDRSADMAARIISGGDAPEAIEATLRKNFGWVQPVYYQTKAKDTKMPPKVQPGIAGRPEFSGVFGDMPESYPGAKPGPGVATQVAYILYDETAKEFYRFNPPGLEWESIGHGVRGTVETVADIGGEMLANRLPFMKPIVGGSRAKRGMDVAKGMTGRSTGAGLFGGAARGLYDYGLEKMGVRTDPRSGKDKMAGVLGTAAAHGAGNLIGEGVLRGPSGAARKALRGKLSPAELRKAQQETSLVTMGREAGGPSAVMAGILPDAGIHRGGGFYRSIEGMLHKSPFGNTTLGDKILRISRGIDEQIHRIIGIGPKSSAKGQTAVGKEIQESIIGKPVDIRGKSRRYKEGGFMGEFEIWKDAVFDPIKTGLSPQAVDITGVRAWKTTMEGRVTAPADRAILAKSGIYDSLDNVLKKNKPTYGDVEDVRQRVGRLMADAREQGRSNSYHLYNKLYKELKRAQETSPGGHKLMGKQLQTKHDMIDRRFYDTMELIDHRLRKIIDATGHQDPYKYIAGLVKTGDADRLEDVVDVIHKSDPDAYKHFIQRYIHDLGRRKDEMGNMSDTFEISTFLNQIKKAWTGETKEALFKYQPEMRLELDNLVRIIHHRFPEYSSRVNPLFTQGALPLGGAGLGAVAGMGGRDSGNQQGGMDTQRIILFSLGGAAIGTGGQHYGAKLLANVNFVKWLANGLESGPGSLVKDVSKLTAIASSAEDIETKIAIGHFLQEFTGNMIKAREIAVQRGKSMNELGMTPPGMNIVDPGALEIKGEKVDLNNLSMSYPEE